MNDLGISEIKEVIWLSDRIYFDFKDEKGLQIEEVIRHLDGLKRISRSVPGLLEKLLKECKFNNVKILFAGATVKELKAGSLENWLNLGLEIMVTGSMDDEDKKKVMEDIKKMSPKLKIGLLIGGLALGWGLKSLTGSSAETSTAINSIQQKFAINIGTTFNLAPDKVLPVLQKGAEKPNAAEIQAALNLTAPAKKHGGDIVVSSGSTDEVKIPSQIVEHLPEQYIRPDKKTMEEEIDDADLQLRAVDIDNPLKGWRAIIPKVIPDQRLKLEIGENVDISKLNALQIKGDVLVTYEVKPDQTKKIVKVQLLRLVK